MEYPPRYAVLLSKQVDPAHFTVIRHTVHGTRPYSYKTTRYGIRNMQHSVDDKPAAIKYWLADGTLISHQWYRYGVKHRDNDRPSEYFPRLKRMYWCRNGARHRDGDRPAVMNTDSYVMKWYRYGIQQAPMSDARYDY